MIKRLSSLHLTIGRLVFGSIYISGLVLVVTVPFWVEYFDGQMKGDAAWCVTAIMAGLVIYSKVYESVDRRTRLAAGLEYHEKLYHTKMMNCIWSLADQVEIKQTQRAVTARDALISHLLDAMRAQARIILQKYDASYFQVTLLLFADPECSTLRVAQRADNARSIGGVVPSNRAMAYFVVKYGRDYRAVNDFHAQSVFPVRSLSDPGSDAPYRSILILPLQHVDRNTKKRYAMGAVTIDAGDPFAFAGKRGERGRGYESGLVAPGYSACGPPSQARLGRWDQRWRLLMGSRDEAQVLKPEKRALGDDAGVMPTFLRLEAGEITPDEAVELLCQPRKGAAAAIERWTFRLFG